LTPPFGRPFTLGVHRLELFRAGSSLGAASLSIDIDGHRIVYTGAVHPRGGNLGGAAERRSADTLILEAEYGARHYRFPDPEEVIPRVIEFSSEVARDGGVAVLLVRHAEKTLDIAHAFRDTDIPLLAHRSLADVARRAPAEPARATVRRAGPRPHPGSVLLWPTRARQALGGTALPPRSRIALVSGCALAARASLTSCT
jgi:putative mRNA 3-end processing factor